MKPRNKVEETIRGRLRFTAGSTLRDRLLTDVMNAQEEFKAKRPALHELGIRRRIMRSPIARVTSVAALIAVAVLSMTLWSKFSTPAYAVEDTYKALQNVRFLHIVSQDEAGRTTDERWIEVGENGYQVRYRQQHPRGLLLKFEQTGQPTLSPGDDLTMVPMAIEDGKSTALFRHDKKAVILYDRKDQQFQWVGDLGGAFKNLRDKGKVLEENVEFHGRPAHKVWWPALNAECYIDPETKLPMGVGDTQISYEEPPAETFEIVIPDGYTVLDKRPDAPAAAAPDWLQEEENSLQNQRESFYQGIRSLARGNYAQAAEQLKVGINVDSWAPFWLGSAYYGLGQYDLAIENYNKHLALHQKAGGGEALPYCHFARGLAYARLGMLDEATKDFQLCLPSMIRTLRTPSGGDMFEYADSPLVRNGQYRPGEYELVAKMINRLRLISGQNFAYDPTRTREQNEAAIAAWEQWLKAGGRIQFTPDAAMLDVPAEWIIRLDWGRKSNEEIATKYTPGWLTQITEPGALLKVGFALYDAKRYDDALAVFEKMEERAGDNQRTQAMAITWQGHMLDLLGRREAAIAKYRQVADMGMENLEQRHEQYGLSYEYNAYARERMAAPFARVENMNDN